MRGSTLQHRRPGLFARHERCDSPCVPSPSQSQSPLPDYQEFVSNARLTVAGEIDRSAVDFAWAATALKRGHPAETVFAELEHVSLKAARLSENARRAYVRRTVSKAGRTVA
ncbi:MAG: hypothetical protein WBV94_10580 [Blastocatellia bacterium]